MLSVRGPSEGIIEMRPYGSSPEFVGPFVVSLSPSAPSKDIYIVYRLRVREMSVGFFTTYGRLGRAADGSPFPSLAERNVAYILPSVLESGLKVRIEVVRVTAEEMEALSSNDVFRDTVRSLFKRERVDTYYVDCIPSRNTQPITSAEIEAMPVAPPPPSSFWPHPYVRTAVITSLTLLVTTICVRYFLGGHRH